MLIGLVKWFDGEKGFGVVATTDNEEYFLHINSFKTKPDKISKGTPIIFKSKIDKTKNKNYAVVSRLVGDPKDWKLILCFLGKTDRIRIELDVKVQGKLGNPYHRKEIYSFSLIGMSLKYFFRDKSETEILNFITDYFDKELAPKDFITYCELIEKSISKHFPSDISTNILNNSFSHFGKNLNSEILFDIWKQKKFKFISYNEMEDYEIPESVLKSNILEIGKSELKRISNFSFSSDFISYYLNKKFDNINSRNPADIRELYQFLEFADNQEKEKRKHQLDNLYINSIEAELIDKANQLDTIRSNDDLDNYNRILQNIPNQFEEVDKKRIAKLIHKIIAQKCSNEFKPEIWVQGIIEELPFECILKYFLDKDIRTEKRISILYKVDCKGQFELLKNYSKEYDFDKSFILLEGLVKKENSFGYNFCLTEVLFDIEFWNDKKGYELIKLFIDYASSYCNDELKYDLFLKGYLKDIPENILRQNIHQFKKDDCKKIFKRLSENKTFIEDVLVQKATSENTSDINWLFDLAIEFLDKENLYSFDKKVFNTIEQSEYFKVWEIGKAKFFPFIKIEEILQDKFESYFQIKSWITTKVTTIEQIRDFLFSYLCNQNQVIDRKIFYKQLNHIRFLLQVKNNNQNEEKDYSVNFEEIEEPKPDNDIGFDIKLNLSQIKQLNNSFYNTVLWLFDFETFFDFEQLKQKFIYFGPDEQVRIIRKLFSLKAKGQFELTISKLNELTRFDLDLYKTNLKFNPEIPIDISTDIVVKALLSYHQNQRFFVESELLTIILNDLKLDKTRRFRLSNYFENCLGRQTAKFDWSRQGEISKVNFGNNQFYFAISFSMGETRSVGNRWGIRDVYYPNPNFEKLKSAVKCIPGVRWNPNEKHWGVPLQYETEVLNFANEYRFFLDFEGSNYTNNIHLAYFKREDIPNGISFCEGRLANRPHEIYRKEFWWCGGQPCFSKCETIHKTEEWEKYTLLDFCEILDLNTDETNKMGDSIPKGHYYQFIALINRLNRLMEKLYCKDCNHILYPSDFGTSHFAAHTIVRFKCRNEKCNNNDEIYLNHCLNGQCNNIIDSRVSKKCTNGLFICNNCGSCCSHNMLERRLANLKLTGGYIHPSLIKSVKDKLGHLERSEYFCYKCKSEMKEISNDIFHCSTCNVKYDTSIYKFKRPHIHLRKQKTPSNNIEDNDLNLPF